MPITASNKFKRIVKQHQSSMYGFPARKQSRCQYKVDPSSTQTRQIEALISPARTPPRSLSPQPAPLHITHAVAQPSLSTPTKQIEALISPARTPPRQSPQPTSTLLHKKQDTSPPSLLTPTKQIEAPVSPARTPPQSSSPQSAQKPLRGRHVTPPPPIPPHQRSNSSPEPKSPGGLGAAMRSDSQLLGRRRKKASITLPTSDVVDNANNNQFLSVKVGLILHALCVIADYWNTTGRVDPVIVLILLCTMWLEVKAIVGINVHSVLLWNVPCKMYLLYILNDSGNDTSPIGHIFHARRP